MVARAHAITLGRNASGDGVGQFRAMASPCEVIVSGEISSKVLREITEMAAQEAWRIEQHWSRYCPGNIVAAINGAQGQAVRVDEETARFLDYAKTLFEWSEGLFDITSGVLRRVWQFDGSDRIPTPKAIAAVMPLVGWQRVQWQSPILQMPAGMEIDFGGIGKEYAVDRALALLKTHCSQPVLVNFGGDLAASAPRADGSAWHVGIETSAHCAASGLALYRGAIASSGDAYRFLLKDGIRYAHLLNPKNGQAIVDGPRTVTVQASSCTEAGVLSTMAMLQGAEAEPFLKAAGAVAKVFW